MKQEDLIKLNLICWSRNANWAEIAWQKCRQTSQILVKREKKEDKFQILNIPPQKRRPQIICTFCLKIGDQTNKQCGGINTNETKN